MKKHFVNNQIRAEKVRLIDHEGNQVGVIGIAEAREYAKKLDLDLVLLSNVTDPPVCKVVDYGQFKYQQKKKDKLSKKTVVTTKEIKMRPKISEHDFQTKVAMTKKFLSKKYKIKLSIIFRGREIVHQGLGEELLVKFDEAIKEVAQKEGEANKSGRFITVNFRPK